MKTILVTGGMGYIGSHTVVELIEQNYDVIIVDDLSNSSVEVLNRINKITGKTPKFYELNCCNLEDFRKVFKENKIDAINLFLIIFLIFFIIYFSRI